MGKKIKMNVLSTSSVQRAINELNAYRQTLDDKVQEFVEKLADVGIKVIEEQVAKAGKTRNDNDTISGSDTTHDTEVVIERTFYGIKATLILSGEEVLFIEYGAGVHYNGAVGQSPHPDGENLGYTIGSYGDGHGAQNAWYYKDPKTGDIVRTYGTKATMPMHYAKNKIISDYVRVAREVFR